MKHMRELDRVHEVPKRSRSLSGLAVKLSTRTLRKIEETEQLT